MLAQRRFLPSTALLAAFETAARTGSITAAARELCLTQSAVSRQIRTLEDQLEVELFIRERQTIRLTPAGTAYLREVRDALHKINTASMNMHANPNGGTLNLAILPTFGTRWLAPRLTHFLRANPGITLNLTTKLSYFDFRAEALDAAIHFGQPIWPGGEMAFLRAEVSVPVCSPELRRQHAFAKPDDLKRTNLLHVSTRPDAWKRWFALNDASDNRTHGMLFDQFATIAQAAIAGVGVALLPTFLIDEELATGKLVQALPQARAVCAPSTRAGARASWGFSAEGANFVTSNESALRCPHPAKDSLPTQGSAERPMSKSWRSLHRAANRGRQAAHQPGAKGPLGKLAISTKYVAAAARNVRSAELSAT